MGTTSQSIWGFSGTTDLSFSKIYRRIDIPLGTYNFTELATVSQTALNNSKSLPRNYMVTANATSGKLSITNSSTLKFEIY